MNPSRPSTFAELLSYTNFAAVFAGPALAHVGKLHTGGPMADFITLSLAISCPVLQ
jgi:hypothetical protein